MGDFRKLATPISCRNMRSLVAQSSRFINKQPFLIGMFLLICIVVKSGIWIMPNLLASRTIALDIQEPSISNTDDGYLIYSNLSSIIAKAVSLTGVWEYILIHLMFGLSALILFIYLLKKRHSKNGNTAIYVLAIIPVTSYVFYWIGIDSLTFLLLAYFAKEFKSKTKASSAGVLLGWQHAEIALVNFCTLAIWAYQSKRIEILKGSLFAACGVIFGRVTQLVFFEVINLGKVESRFEIAFDNLSSIFWTNLKLLPLSVWTILGPLWFVVLTCLTRKEIRWLISSLLFPALVYFFVADQSRFLQMSTVLLVWFAILENKQLISKLTDKVVLLIAVWVVIPWIWVYVEPQGSVFLYDLQILKEAVSGKLNEVTLNEFIYKPFS